MENLIQHGGLTIRDTYLEKAIVAEVRRSYEWMNTYEENVLDIGGCFGAYARLAEDQGAVKVWTYEPEPDNFSLLKMNCKGYPRIKPYNGAVVSGDEKHVNFYVNTGLSNACHSTVEYRGRDVIQVRAYNFDQILDDLKPSTVKMDCEGSEFDLLTKPLPECVEKITVEIHFRKKKWRGKPARDLIDLFSKWEMVKEPTIGEKNWTTIGAWQR